MTHVNLRADLPALAFDINREHEAAERAINDSLDHARRCGELLMEAKARCEHGQWQAWVEANFADSIRTAQGYMRIASKWEANAQPVAHLGVKDALAALAEPRERQVPFAPRDRNRGLYADHLDNEAGWSPEKAEAEKGPQPQYDEEMRRRRDARREVREAAGPDLPAEPPTAAGVRRHLARPLDGRVRGLIAAAQPMADVDDDDLGTLRTNDLMIEGLRNAVRQITRIIDMHAKNRSQHANG